MENKEVEVLVEICREGVMLPEYARLYDAGMDVRTACDVEIKPGETKLIPTGLKMAIPEGYEIQVRPRSGISLRTPLRLPNSPGTIDAGYRDEICVMLTNTGGSESGDFQIKKGERIAQFVLCRVPRIKFKVVENVAEYGYNRGGGFGSTSSFVETKEEKPTGNCDFLCESLAKADEENKFEQSEGFMNEDATGGNGVVRVGDSYRTL